MDKLDKKLSSRAVLKEDMGEFVNRELIPVVEKLRLLTNALLDTLNTCEGSPEGVITADPPSIRLRTDGAPGTQVYVKQSGVGTNTGWVAVL